MTQPIYINLDANWLQQESNRLISEGDFERGLRLSTIAGHLQSLDDKLQALQSAGEFAAGVKEAYERVYSRSNLASKDLDEPGELTPTQQEQFLAAKQQRIDELEL